MVGCISSWIEPVKHFKIKHFSQRCRSSFLSIINIIWISLVEPCLKPNLFRFYHAKVIAKHWQKVLKRVQFNYGRRSFLAQAQLKALVFSSSLNPNQLYSVRRSDDNRPRVDFYRFDLARLRLRQKPPLMASTSLASGTTATTFSETEMFSN